jgi:hypothetical protein
MSWPPRPWQRLLGIHEAVRPVPTNALPTPVVSLERTEGVFREKTIMRTSRASITGVLLLLAAGCARSPAPAAGPSPVASADTSHGGSSRAIAVQVNNQNFNDMDVYLVHDGARWLVGQVGGLTQATLTVPANLVPADQRVRLSAEAIGGAGGTTTPLLIVAPGQQVYWTIGSDPAMSTASAG